MTTTAKLFIRKATWMKNGESHEDITIKFKDGDKKYTAFRTGCISTAAWNAIKADLSEVREHASGNYRMTNHEFDITFRVTSPDSLGGKIYIESVAQAAEPEKPEDLGL